MSTQLQHGLAHRESERGLDSLHLPKRPATGVEIEVKYVIPTQVAQRVIREFGLPSIRIHQSYFPKSEIKTCLSTIRPYIRDAELPFGDLKNEITQMRVRRVEHSNGDQSFYFALKGKRGAGDLGILSRLEFEIPITKSTYSSLRHRATEGYILKDRFTFSEVVSKQPRLSVDRNHTTRALVPFQIEIDLIRAVGPYTAQDQKYIQSGSRYEIALVDCEIDSSLSRQFGDRKILTAFQQGKHNISWLRDEGFLATGDKDLHDLVRAPRIARKEMKQVYKSLCEFMQYARSA